MRYRQLGTTGTQVSVLCLGAGDLELPAEAVTRLDTASSTELGYPYEFIKNVDGAW